METNESSFSALGAEEILTPAQAAAENSQQEKSATHDDANATDPEAQAEEEMTEGIEMQEEQEKNVQRPANAEEVIAAACDVLAREAAEISSDDVRRLRAAWNAVRPAATPAVDTVDAEEPKAEPDADAVAAAVKQEEMFAAILTQIRDKKAAYMAEVEAKRAETLERKNAIIEEIKQLADDTDNVNRTFPRYRELQDEFNALGEVPATEETAVWKRYQEARELYSDNLKINKELRDYDFKKNLDSKMLLLQEAEGLEAEEDVITAYRRLQELHNKWRRIGPVAKEIRQENTNKFE
ncbi:MAG: DUF349 domain-containing protein [Muribaculaceae bacterium]|nr:DUF349 domain-containing protein [Muribaculaceae bacterium]